MASSTQRRLVSSCWMPSIAGSGTRSIHSTESSCASHCFIQVDNPALIIDSVKKAEESDALIVRLYEARGTRGAARLSTSLPLRSAALTNLLEDEIGALRCDDKRVELNFKPFEIITVKMEIGTA